MENNSKLYLLAIGGTGARVVRSLTMLLASGIDGLNSTIEVVPVIIDFDLGNGDLNRAVDALKQYHLINTQLYPAGGTTVYDNHYFMTRITSLWDVGKGGKPDHCEDYKMYFGPAGKSLTFAESLGFDALNNNPDTRVTADLMRCLYDDSPEKLDAVNSNPDAELNLDLTVGFKGNPNIGSVVFHSIRNNEAFKRMESNIGTNDRVFIVSSIFGGTGSSGFPELVRAIHNSTAPLLNTAKLGAVVVLPYFNLTNTGGAIDANSFNSKAKDALEYYANNLNEYLKALYYVGDTKRDNPNYAEGGTAQINPAQTIEFVAATAVIDFMLKSDALLNTSTAYEYGLNAADEEINLTYSHFDNGSKFMFLKRLHEFAMAMKYYNDRIHGARNQVGESKAYFGPKGYNLNTKKYQGIYECVNNFLPLHTDGNYKNNWGFCPWVAELESHNGARSLKFFRMDTKSDCRSMFVFKGENPIEMGFGKFNPFKDDYIDTKLNEGLKHMGNDTSECAFFKNLRDVMQASFSSIG